MKTDSVASIRLPGFACGLLLFALLQQGHAQSSVVINECLASNRSILENQGSFPDWVELYNVTTEFIDLGDWSLSDDPTLPRKFIFPAGTLIQPNGFLLVYCDDQTALPGIHTGFGLSDKGESLALFSSLASGGFAQDSVTFGLQLPDQSIGRSPDFTGPFVLNVPTPAAPNTPAFLGDPATLKINEWSALNGPSASNPRADWLELYNPDGRPVALGGLILTDQTAVPPTDQPLASLSFIAGSGFVQFFADDELTPADNVNFRLGSTSGDNILLYQPDRFTLIDSVSFGPQTLNISQGRLPDGAAFITSFPTNQPTPGASNFLPITNVVVNEVLTHTDPPLEDAIELLNVSSVSVDISHWWLSDSRSEPQKFRIPAGTVLPPGGFVVFYEGVGTTVGFNTSGTGISPDFSLSSSKGDEVFMFSGNAAGDLTGFEARVNFDAAENGVSFGRYVTSTGEAAFTALTRRTFGADTPATVEQFRTGTGLPNAAPKVGPIVISEIMYHPPDLPGSTNDNSGDEFIELHNITPATVILFDPLFPVNTWRIRGEVDFDFPQNQSLAAGQTLLVVNFDPANFGLLSAFRDKFRVPAGVPIYGPYEGKLGNGSATIDLTRPDIPDEDLVPRILVDRVKYSDNAPWPVSPDGLGDSLQRCMPDAYGNDPINWAGAPPTAGSPGVGITIRSIQRSGATLTICFSVCAGRTYSVLSAASITATTWTKVADAAPAVTGNACVNTSVVASDTAKFFRVVSPAQ